MSLIQIVLRLFKDSLGDFISLKWTCILAHFKILSRGVVEKFPEFFGKA